MEQEAPKTHSFALPWHILVTPGNIWRLIAERSPWVWAVAFHWVFNIVGQVAVAGSSQELLLTAGLSSRVAPVTPASVIAMAIVSLVLLLAGLLACALVGMILLRTIGSRLTLSLSLSWVSYALIPVSVGSLFGKLTFAIVQPLAASPVTALAYLVRPLSLNYNDLLAPVLPPLSFGWFVISFFDLFAIWSIFLLYLGATRLLHLTLIKKLWLIAGLMIVFFAVITGLWNLTQFALLKVSG